MSLNPRRRIDLYASLQLFYVVIVRRLAADGVSYGSAAPASQHVQMTWAAVAKNNACKPP